MNDPTTEAGSVGIVETRIAEIDLPESGFRLESGESLTRLDVAYETYGSLSDKRDNVILVCHALTGDAHAAGWHSKSDEKPGWWDQMIGPGKGIDTDYYFVVCSNILGGCMGTTGPSSRNPATGKPYGSAFPPITVGDMVRAQRMLLDHLDVTRIAAVVGGSLGGMQALEWSIRYPEMVSRCVCIAAGVSLSAQALAFDMVAHEAIVSDPGWKNGDYYDSGTKPDAGLSQARKIGHITYLSPEMMTAKFGREKRPADEPGTGTAFRGRFQVGSYLDHQGRKLADRFDANSYLHIARAMDEFDLEIRHGSLAEAFAPVMAKTLVVALSADWLFPPEQSRHLARALLRSRKEVSYCELHAPHGHDAFLVDIKHLSELVRAFLPWVESGSTHCDHHPLGSKEEFSIILDRIREGAHVLDLGCGNGDLLAMLAQEKKTSGIGVDIDVNNVVETLNKGFNALHGDLDNGLANVPDDSHDYAILSETLQVVSRPRQLLREMLRTAKEGIVTFPNFANWSCRLHLGILGRMPVSRTLPFQWYDTPNIHLTTLRDFADLCAADGIQIVEIVCIPKCGLGRMLVGVGLRNLGADRVLVRIAKKRPAQN